MPNPKKQARIEEVGIRVEDWDGDGNEEMDWDDLEAAVPANACVEPKLILVRATYIKIIAEPPSGLVVAKEESEEFAGDDL